MKNDNFISIVVPCFNEAENIDKCLRSLLDQDYPADRFEIIVVDNGSTDDTVKIVSRYSVTCIELKNGNVGAVRNKGVSVAKGSTIAFIDGDCIAPANWIKTAYEQLKDQDDLVVGGGIVLSDDANWVERYWLLEGADGITLPRDLIGCSIIMPKNIFLKAGGFDENITSGEDSKLSKTLQRDHIKIHIQTPLSVIHLGNAKTPLRFIIRQVWHAENYLRDFDKSFKDPVFQLTVGFMFLIILSLLFWLFDSRNINVTIFLLVLIPLILTAKRIKRSGAIRKNIKNILPIYILDWLYLVGRSAGILKSIISTCNPHKRLDGF